MANTNKGYNYNFKMYLEGIEVRFISANIICTPQGVEASITMQSNDAIFILKPKTAVQIFYKEWTGTKRGWRLMFDGFFSRFDKSDSLAGRGVSILCRDFRMDIRKAPAALAYENAGKLENPSSYTLAGMRRQAGYSRTFNATALADLSTIVQRVAGAAAGKASKSSRYKLPKDDDGDATGRFFLDAFVRGLWMEASNHTAISRYMNKRLLVGKRIFTPSNEAGYNMWKAQNLSKLGGDHLTGNSKFSSIEATIMRLAGMFMVRVYSCNSPSLINLNETIGEGPNQALNYAMDKTVHNFIVNKSADEFGPKYMLNETMLLPPMEFTAPPTCNLMFPCMYDRVTFQHDQDVDITRGYFKQGSWIESVANSTIGTNYTQVPTNLFKKASAYDIPPLTLEERYGGVNVLYGNVSHTAGESERRLDNMDVIFKASIAAEIRAEVDRLKNAQVKSASSEVSDAVLTQKATTGELSPIQVTAIQAKLKKKKLALIKAGAKNKVKKGGGVAKVMERHAMLKFINNRYAGRVATTTMAFNPYIMCGFPGIIVADQIKGGYNSLKSIIGMVQQVKHYIVREGEAMTSVVLNNSRYIDEPTDLSGDGMALYLPQTDPEKAEIFPNTLEYVIGNDTYFVPDPKPRFDPIEKDQSEKKVKKTTKDKKKPVFALEFGEENTDYAYAKDILTISRAGARKHQSNLSYLDNIYEPNKISKFYKDVFNQEESFMVGTWTFPQGHKREGETISYMFDSIEEAVERLNFDHYELLGDYTKAMAYVRRNVCSEEAFFCGILGMTLKQRDANDSSKIVFNTKLKDYDSIANNKYFGVSSKVFDKLDAEYKNSETGSIKEAGQFSSIRETIPITSFISERREAVEWYRKETEKQGHAVQGINQ